MNELRQKSFGYYKLYKIISDRILVTTKNFNKYEEYYIKLDTLGLDINRKQTKRILLLIPLYLAFTGLEVYVLVDEYRKGTGFLKLLFWVFGALLFAAGAVYSFFQTSDQLFIVGGENILELDGSNPNKKTVDNFVHTLQTAVKNYYKKKYAIIDPALNKESLMHNYKWLNEMGVLTEDEYHELLDNLNMRDLLS